MIFTVAIISPATTGLKAGKRREGDRLVDPVEPVDGVLVDHQHAGDLREQIGAAGEGAIDVHAVAGDLLGDLGGGDVLGDVARLEPRHHDVLDAGGLERRDLGGPISVPFLSTRSPCRIECTAVAPRASFGATAPNFMTPPLRPARRRLPRAAAP